VPSAGLEYYIHQSDDVGIRAPIGSQWIALDSPYDPLLVGTLKVHFGCDARRWNPETKLWYVWRELETRLLNVLKDIGYSVLWTRPAGRKKTAPASRTQAKPAAKPAAKSAGARPAAKPATPFHEPFRAASNAAPPRPAISFRPSTDHELLEILPTARFEVAKAAYRALCLVHHPDHGGDLRKIQALNAAWERLCKRYGRQT